MRPWALAFAENKARPEVRCRIAIAQLQNETRNAKVGQAVAWDSVLFRGWLDSGAARARKLHESEHAAEQGERGDVVRGCQPVALQPECEHDRREPPKMA